MGVNINKRDKIKKIKGDRFIFKADRNLSSCASQAGGGQSPQILLFGSPQDRIENYMADSNPDGGDNDPDCECGR